MEIEIKPLEYQCIYFCTHFLRLREVKEIFLMLTQGITIKKSHLFAKIA